MAEGDLPDIFRYYGFAEEDTSGTAETTPEMYADVQSIATGIPDGAEMDFEGMLGRGQTLHRPGFYSADPSIETGTDIKILDRFLFFALGLKETVTTAEDVTNYIYSTNKVLLPTFTSFMGVDLNEYVVPGCVMDKLELDVSNDFLTMKASMKGTKHALGTLKDPEDITFNEDYPLAFYEVNIYVRDKGSVVDWGELNIFSEDVQKLTNSIENSADEKAGQGLGSRFPYKVPVGKRTLGLKFDSTYLSNQWNTLLWGSENGPQDNEGSTEVEMMIKIDAGDFGTADIFFPRVIIKKAPVDPKGRDPMSQSIEISTYEENVTIPLTPTAKTVKTDCLVTTVIPVPDVTP